MTSEYATKLFLTVSAQIRKQRSLQTQYELYDQIRNLCQEAMTAIDNMTAIDITVAKRLHEAYTKTLGEPTK